LPFETPAASAAASNLSLLLTQVSSSVSEQGSVYDSTQKTTAHFKDKSVSQKQTALCISEHIPVSPKITEAINRAVGSSTRPMVTSPAAEHHCLLAGTKLYCKVTEAHVSEIGLY